jgi:hypothetical protein
VKEQKMKRQPVVFDCMETYNLDHPGMFFCSEYQFEMITIPIMVQNKEEARHAGYRDWKVRKANDPNPSQGTINPTKSE